MGSSSGHSQQAASQTTTTQDTSKQAVLITDNRSEAVVQRKEMEGATNSPRAVAQRKEFAEAFGSGSPDPKPNTTGMPDTLKTGLENYSGMDLSDVKVHYNSSKPARLQALAYAQGNDIHLGPGQEKHLPHEGWHVVQQRQGRVKPTLQLKGVRMNDDKGLEKEADVMGGMAGLRQGQEFPIRAQAPLMPGNEGFNTTTAQLMKDLEKDAPVIITKYMSDGNILRGTITQVVEGGSKYEVNIGKELPLMVFEEQYVMPASLLSPLLASKPKPEEDQKNDGSISAAMEALKTLALQGSSANDSKQGKPLPFLRVGTPASVAAGAASSLPVTNSHSAAGTPPVNNKTTAITSVSADHKSANVDTKSAVSGIGSNSVLSKSVLNVVGEIHNNHLQELEKEFLLRKFGFGSDEYWLEDKFKIVGADGTEIFGDSLKLYFPYEKLIKVKNELGGLLDANYSAGQDFKNQFLVSAKVTKLLGYAKLMKQDFQMLNTQQQQQLKNVETTVEELISLIETNNEPEENPEVLKGMKKKIEALEKMIDHTNPSLDDQRSKAMHEAAQKGKDKKGVWKIGQAHVDDIRRMRLVTEYNLVDSSVFVSEFTKGIIQYAHAEVGSASSFASTRLPEVDRKTEISHSPLSAAGTGALAAISPSPDRTTSVAKAYEAPPRRHHLVELLRNKFTASQLSEMLKALDNGYPLVKLINSFNPDPNFNSTATAAAGTDRPTGSSGLAAGALRAIPALPPSALASGSMPRRPEGDQKKDGSHDPMSAAGAGFGALTAASGDVKKSTGTALDTKGEITNKATTNYGIFKAEVYEERYSESSEGVEIGCDISLSFIPFSQQALVGKKIGLIQTVTPIKGALFAPSAENGEREDLEHLLHEGSEPKVNTIIDRDDAAEEVMNPVYGTNSKSKKLNDDKFNVELDEDDGEIEEGDDDSDNSFGKLIRIEPFEAIPAKLYDGPTRFHKSGKQSMEFETAAVLLDPPHTYLGSVKWGWIKANDSKKENPKVTLIPLTVAGLGDPSEGFISAAKVWNKIKNKNGKELIKIPIPGDEKSHSAYDPATAQHVDNKNATSNIVKVPNECCYITTACVEYMGLGDDCEELMLLRQFRDGYLLNKPNGKALIELYYRYSPQIVTSIKNNENYDEILKRLFGIIRQCVQAIKQGNNEVAFQTYCEMVIKLKEIFIPHFFEVSSFA
jgi:hypothetical protein